MSITTKSYVSVSETLRSLGLNFPSEVVLLPENFDSAKNLSDLRQQTEAETLKTIFRINNIPYADLFDDSNRPPYLQNYGYEWFGPTLFISASLLSQNPNFVSVALGLLTNYLSDLFKGAESGTASLSIVLESANGACTKVDYRGPPSGLKEVSKAIKASQQK